MGTDLFSRFLLPGLCGDRRFHADIDQQSRVREHRNERVRAEEIDLPAQEVANPRLGNAECGRGLFLSQPPRANILFDFGHQPRPHVQVGGFLWAKAQIGKHVL